MTNKSKLKIKYKNLREHIKRVKEMILGGCGRCITYQYVIELADDVINDALDYPDECANILKHSISNKALHG